MEKSKIIFLPVPDSLKNEVDFKVDPNIQLPIELPAGETNLDPEKLTWEMIMSGMLRIISGQDRNHVPDEWKDYYRNFVLSMMPEIFHEFTSAAIVKCKNGEFDMAIEISHVLEGLFPLSPGVLLNKALILESRAAALEAHGRSAEKENAETLEAYEAALSARPVFPDTLFNAGFFFLSKKEFARSRECFSSYIEGWEEAQARQDIPAEHKADFPDEKVKQAKKILLDIKNQGLDDPIIKEAHDCISRGNDEEGLIKIRQFIEKRPKVWNGWFILGWALRKLGRYSDGGEAFKKALELGGPANDIRNETAICLMEQGDLKGAKKELELALRDDTENTKIISNLGVVAMKAGNMEEAKAYFRTVLELDPEDPLAKQYAEQK